MKNKWIRSAAILALSTIMVIGINAQNQGGQGQGPDGQGYGPRANKGFGQGQGYGTRAGMAYGRTNGPGTRDGSGLNRLDLTEEQQKEIQTMKLANYKEMKPLRAEMNEIKAREKTLMAQEEINKKALNKLIDEQTDLMNKIQKKQLSHKLAFKEILTDEQEMKMEQKRNHAGKRPQRRM